MNDEEHKGCLATLQLFCCLLLVAVRAHMTNILQCPVNCAHACYHL